MVFELYLHIWYVIKVYSSLMCNNNHKSFLILQLDKRDLGRWQVLIIEGLKE